MYLPSIEHLRQEVTRLERQMSHPELQRNPSEMRQIAREYTHTQSLLKVAEQLAVIAEEKRSLQAILTYDNEEMRVLIEEDMATLDTKKRTLHKELETLLIPKDPRDERGVALEIRAGTGGEEAALFARELFRAYTRYAETAHWHMHVVSQSLSEQGGYKEVIAEIDTPNVFGILKFERGVHRVQRTPATEKQGRIHTSTVTVAVLPQAEEIDLVIRSEDLRIDTYRSSGAGGQHVNKTSSAVRITHVPTNTVVAVQDERSQHKNREKAMKILRARILAAQEEAQRQQKDQDRRTQVGTGDRSEKIRTYNFPRDRITDHRIKQSFSNIEGVMEGKWDAIFSTMREADRAQHLSSGTKST